MSSRQDDQDLKRLADELVADGRMPKPIRINARTVSDRFKIDEAFGALACDGPNPWDEL